MRPARPERAAPAARPFAAAFGSCADTNGADDLWAESPRRIWHRPQVDGAKEEA